MSKAEEAARYKRLHGEWPDWFDNMSDEEKRVAKSLLRRLARAVWRGVKALFRRRRSR